MAGSKMQGRLGFLLILILSAFELATYRANAAESANLRKVRMAFTSLSASMMPPWLARETGIFAKHGLDVEVIATPTGDQRVHAFDDVGARLALKHFGLLAAKRRAGAGTAGA